MRTTRPFRPDYRKTHSKPHLLNQRYFFKYDNVKILSVSLKRVDLSKEIKLWRQENVKYLCKAASTKKQKKSDYALLSIHLNKSIYYGEKIVCYWPYTNKKYYQYIDISSDELDQLMSNLSPFYLNILKDSKTPDPLKNFEYYRHVLTLIPDRLDEAYISHLY